MTPAPRRVQLPYALALRIQLALNLTQNPAADFNNACVGLQEAIDSLSQRNKRSVFKEGEKSSRCKQCTHSIQALLVYKMYIVHGYRTSSRRLQLPQPGVRPRFNEAQGSVGLGDGLCWRCQL